MSITVSKNAKNTVIGTLANNGNHNIGTPYSSLLLAFLSQSLCCSNLLQISHKNILYSHSDTNTKELFFVLLFYALCYGYNRLNATTLGL